jgi:hypothetical protein
MNTGSGAISLGGGRRDGETSKLVVIVDELGRVVGVVVSVIDGVRVGRSGVH